MRIYGNKTYSEYKKDPRGVAVALGNFDGVHLGHQALVAELVKIAAEEGRQSLVYTFEKHPMEVLSGGGAGKPRLIMTNADKARIMEKLGADGIFFESFDREYAAMDCDTFAREIIRDKLGTAHAVVGSNYSFGLGGSGNPETLKKLGEKYGFKVTVIEPVTVGGTVVSSTLLRGLIATGDVGAFPEYAGRPYTVPGKVTHGRAVGRNLGFQTANITPKRGFATPADGVYATKTLVDGKIYDGATNIGKNPTFGLRMRSIETFLFDADVDLYGREIRVAFIKMLRPEIKFESPELLEKQIANDVAEAKTILARTDDPFAWL
ncbi:MAG: bifunctional riboflavin kinase/FAD synthetase [Clostridia bacterium]|nr:bifunctional riboflavin kinase/FAD synthetase [Clostridia bacterium]